MPANLVPTEVIGEREPAVRLGPQGPFPEMPLSDELERRWLHYAFLSRDHSLCMVANVSTLGPPAERNDADARRMTILLLHRRGSGWRASQFNARTSLPTWSAFRRPGFSRLSLELGATCGAPAVRLQLARTGHPCTSQTAPVCAGQHFRWQSEPGILARGQWRYDDDVLEDVAAVGYHERVRGRWSWPALGGWVFGFINETASAADGPPGTALVFTLIQPREMRHVSGSVMLWRNGRLKRHFPRRRVSVAVCGELDRSRVACVPPLAELFGVAPTAPVPQRLVVTAALGEDHALLDFEAESAARIVIPSESGLLPFSVHEVYGPCRLEGRVNGAAFACDSFGIVEFAGGACED